MAYGQRAHVVVCGWWRFGAYSSAGLRLGWDSTVHSNKSQNNQAKARDRPWILAMALKASLGADVSVVPQLSTLRYSKLLLRPYGCDPSLDFGLRPGFFFCDSLSASRCLSVSALLSNSGWIEFGKSSSARNKWIRDC